MVTNETIEIVGRMNAFFAETGKTNKAEVSRRMVVDSGTMGNILRGERGPSVEVIQKFLAAFPEVSAEWLMRGVGNMLKDESPLFKYILEERDKFKEENIQYKKIIKKLEEENKHLQDLLKKESLAS
jgi:cytochrome c556